MRRDIYLCPVHGTVYKTNTPKTVLITCGRDIGRLFTVCQVKRFIREHLPEAIGKVPTKTILDRLYEAMAGKGVKK